jgi:hypothetical protein
MILVKTEVGQVAFKERSPLFSARQRSAFIMFDGARSIDQVLAATAGMGVTLEDIDHMMSLGFLLSKNPVLAEPAQAPASDFPASSPQARYQAGKLLATQLTARLGLRGFMLNLAVESAAGYDELLALLPKIQDAVGVKACRELERALKG